jgi:hypothetical protein
MPRKTYKRSRKSRRATIRRYRKKGGSDSQSLIIPTTALKVSDGGVPSQDIVTGISKI